MNFKDIWPMFGKDRVVIMALIQDSFPSHLQEISPWTRDRRAFRPL